MNQEPSLTFCVDHFDDSIEGSFVPSEPDEWAVLDERFDNALDSLEAGRINEQGFVSECKAILKLEPYFLDAYAHLGNHGHANGKSSAYSWYKKGYELGLKLCRPISRAPSLGGFWRIDLFAMPPRLSFGFDRKEKI